MGIKAGSAVVNITPPVGFPQAGYGSRIRGSETVDDELFAKVLVLDDGKTNVGIVTTDLIGLPAWLVSEIRQRAERRTGIPGENFLLCASHSHFGPALKRLYYMLDDMQVEFDESYVRNLTGLIAGGIFVAHNNLREASIGWAVGNGEGLSFNRRTRLPDGKVVMSFLAPDPERAKELSFGPVDPDVGVIRVDAPDGEPIASLVNFACHPVCGVDRLYAISADYPGHTTNMIEKLRGGVCLFALGCAGNIVPIEREGRAREWIGRALGAEALKTLELTKTEAEVELAVSNEKLDLPIRPLPAVEEAEKRLREAEEKFRVWEEKGAKPQELANPRGEFIHARFTYHRAKEFAGRKTLTTELQVIRIGELLIVGLPGEVFVEIGLELKRARPDTFLFSLSNDSLDYVPLSAAYDEGGYEPEWTILGRGAGEKILEAGLRLCQQLR